MVELGHMVAHEHLGVSVSRTRVVLSHMHPQDRAHDPDDESGKANETSSHFNLVTGTELRVVLLPSPVNTAEVKLWPSAVFITPHSFTASALNIISFSYFVNCVASDGKTVEILQRGTNLRASGLQMLNRQSRIMESFLGGCETLNLLLPLNAVPAGTAAQFANICKS